MTLPADNVSQTREQRLEELTDLRQQAQINADALEALVQLIANASVPVAQYQQTWLTVERRLRQDVREARKRVELMDARCDDIRRAQVARENWTPPDTSGPRSVRLTE